MTTVDTPARIITSCVCGVQFQCESSFSREAQRAYAIWQYLHLPCLRAHQARQAVAKPLVLNGQTQPQLKPGD